MRVLLITDWNPLHGGAEAYIVWLRAGLTAAGDEVRLLTSSAGSAGEGSADYVAYGTQHVLPKAILQIVNPFAAATVGRAVRSFRPDVVYVNMFALYLSPAIFAALRDTPTVLAVSDYKCVCPMGSKLLPNGTICAEPAGWVCCRKRCVSLPHWIRDRPRYALMGSAVSRVDRVLACSRWIQHELARHGIRSDWLTLPVPPPGPMFRRAPAPTPTFVYVGRLEVEKGVETLLRAFVRVREAEPQARLRIVGRGNQAAHLQQLATTLGLTPAVTFTGWLGPDQVEQQLSDPWALVAPSLWAEPLGLVALEAIVRGVPVIASENGGFADTVEHGVSGLLFPNGDETALAPRMLEIIRARDFTNRAIPPDIVQRMAERHGMERHVRQVRAIFTEMVGGAGPGAPGSSAAANSP
jgi:glycosyltransferase involved in cell wall biosynthesis